MSDASLELPATSTNGTNGHSNGHSNGMALPTATAIPTVTALITILPATIRVLWS
jgi:hypothetical protein